MRSMLAEIHDRLPPVSHGYDPERENACEHPEREGRFYYGDSCPACFVALHAVAHRKPDAEHLDLNTGKRCTIREMVNGRIIECGLPLPLVPT